MRPKKEEEGSVQVRRKKRESGGKERRGERERGGEERGEGEKTLSRTSNDQKESIHSRKHLIRLEGRHGLHRGIHWPDHHRWQSNEHSEEGAKGLIEESRIRSESLELIALVIGRSSRRAAEKERLDEPS